MDTTIYDLPNDILYYLCKLLTSREKIFFAKAFKKFFLVLKELGVVLHLRNWKIKIKNEQAHSLVPSYPDMLDYLQNRQEKIVTLVLTCASSMDDKLTRIIGNVPRILRDRIFKRKHLLSMGCTENERERLVFIRNILYASYRYLFFHVTYFKQPVRDEKGVVFYDSMNWKPERTVLGNEDFPPVFTSEYQTLFHEIVRGEDSMEEYEILRETFIKLTLLCKHINYILNDVKLIY